MKKNRWLFLAVTAIILACAFKVYAGTISMTTYYPAPTGFYTTMKVTDTLIIPCYKPTSVIKPTATTGAVWMEDSSGSCIN